MRMRALGRTGIQVSPYCLGTMMFGKLGNPDHDDCARIIHRALDAGINFIDTADVYGYSETEQIVGKALKGRRDNVIVATKFNGAMGEDPNQRGSSRRWIITAVEDSLRRLQVDHIDLYQIHHPEPDTDMEEILSALTDLLRSGKVRAIGSSNLPASEIVEAQWVAERRGLARLRTEQPTYSILNRAIEREVLPVCERYGLGTLVWSPLASGMLAGRYRKGRQSNNQRLNWAPKYLTDERALDLVEDLHLLAREAGMPLAHLAIAFAVTHPGVTSAIIGPRTMEQLEDLLAAADVALDDALLDRIDALAPPGTDVATLDLAYKPPALQVSALRRRPADARSAARTAIIFPFSRTGRAFTWRSSPGPAA
jgi:aryl-alcohol dehydrogenase-like predicted oxidoreductase